MAIIIKPIVTEKMTGMGEKFNRYGFAVTRCRQATDQRSRRRPLQCNRCFGKHDYEKRKTQKSLY